MVLDVQPKACPFRHFNQEISGAKFLLNQVGLNKEKLLLLFLMAKVGLINGISYSAIKIQDNLTEGPCKLLHRQDLHRQPRSDCSTSPNNSLCRASMASLIQSVLAAYFRPRKMHLLPNLADRSMLLRKHECFRPKWVCACRALHGSL